MIGTASYGVFTGARGGGPGHDLEVEQKDVVVEFVAVPAAENEHLGAADEVRALSEARGRGAAALWALVPGHGHGVQGVQVAKNLALLTFAAEDNYPGTGQYRAVEISGARRGTGNLGFLRNSIYMLTCQRLELTSRT